MNTETNDTPKLRFPHDTPWADAKQAGEYCGISQATLYRMLARDVFPRPSELPDTGMGKGERPTLRWHKDTLDDWMRSLARSAPTPGKVVTK